MVSNSLGHIQDNLYKLGFTECPVFLLDGPEPVIFDAGVTCAGKTYAGAIRSVLGDRQPSLLLLTHVHWDHCGSVSYLKSEFPKMQVGASSLAAQILMRPNAVALIRKLNEVMASRLGSLPEDNPLLPLIDEPFAPFGIDIQLQDNQVLELGAGITLEVLATPGHTQDHCSYSLAKGKVLMAGEAAGVYYSPEIVSTEFVSSYDAYLSSLRRLSALPAEVFCQGHYQHLLGREEIRAFFERSINETVSFKDRVLELLNEEAGCQDRVIARLKTERYDVIPGPKQPEYAYLLNLKAQVAHLAAKG